MKNLFVLGLSAILFASCGNHSSANKPETDLAKSKTCIDNMKLAIVELNGTELINNANNSQPQIQFIADSKTVSANVGCNTINATYSEKDNGKLAIEMALSTKMACPDELREDEFIDAFNKIAGYTFDEKYVVFIDSSNTILFKCSKIETCE